MIKNGISKKLAPGLISKISSKKYSAVAAVLTYPTKANSINRQEDD
jgi:hypothetical protein